MSFGYNHVRLLPSQSGSTVAQRINDWYRKIHFDSTTTIILSTQVKEMSIYAMVEAVKKSYNLIYAFRSDQCSHMLIIMLLSNTENIFIYYLTITQQGIVSTMILSFSTINLINLVVKCPLFKKWNRLPIFNITTYSLWVYFYRKILLFSLSSHSLIFWTFSKWYLTLSIY